MTFVIEKNVPLPEKNIRWKYPFDQMEVGDSFAVPEGINRTRVSVAAMRYGREHKMKFTVRQMPDRSLRCWRIA